MKGGRPERSTQADGGPWPLSNALLWRQRCGWIPVTGEGRGKVRAGRGGGRGSSPFTPSRVGSLETLCVDGHYSAARGTLAGCQESPGSPLTHTTLHKPPHFHTSDPHMEHGRGHVG